MTIERMYGTEDNKLNKSMFKNLQNYCKKHNEEICKVVIYAAQVTGFTASGRELIYNAMETKHGHSIYLKERINGKQKRVPYSEW